MVGFTYGGRMAGKSMAQQVIEQHLRLCRAITTTSATTTLTPALTAGTGSVFDPWALWNDQWTTAATTTSTSSGVWTHWLDEADATLRAAPRVLPAPSPEQLRAEEVRQAAGRAQYLRAHGERTLARQKAQALLAQALDDRQKVELAQNGWFELVVHSKSGERRRYRIHRGRAGNVQLVDEQGKHLRRYCIHPIIACPDEDTMLTQKLWLETNEELFLRTANAS